MKYHEVKWDSKSKLKANSLNLESWSSSHIWVSTDLIDCGIEICAKEIIRHIKEDQNLSSLKQNFCNAILESEISNDSIYMSEIED